ncbi:MAG: hypothetical protein ACQCXQ_07815 [Verrucomicrobiales bacterium]|nr:hypothetical protein [Verrucomicrobiota bacterium JB025]
MKLKTTTGCGIAVFAILLAFLIAVFLIVGLFTKVRSKHHEALTAEVEAIAHNAREATAGSIILNAGDTANIPPYTGTSPLTREQYLAFMTDSGMTALARSEFRSRATDTTVSWQLRVRDIRDSGGEIRAKFSIPYQIQSANQTTASTIQIDATFSEASRELLLPVRQGDWLQVEGRISFKNDSLSLSDARVTD